MMPGLPIPWRRLATLALTSAALAASTAASCSSSLVITSPATTGAPVPVPSGVVTIAFAVDGFSLGDQGQRHLHFYLDGDLTPYHFYNGATQEVLYEGVHTHLAHWKSPNAIELFALAPGLHSVRFALAEPDHRESLYGAATRTLLLDVQPPPAGDFVLEPVLTGLAFPLSIAFAPNGLLFYNEWQTGRIRVVEPGFVLREEPLYTVPDLVIGGERGLLGLAIDPDFTANHHVYVYYTAANPLRNRVLRLTERAGLGSEPTVIRDDLPASTGNHVGGVIQFGPDRKLYVVVGDVDVPGDAQSLSSFAGKILRFERDGRVPAYNPIPGSPIWALGIRNSFGFTFHPHTGDLWETENGPDTSDEINRIVPLGNYGWPLVRGIVGDARFVDPLLAIDPTIAPTGIAIPSERSIYPEEFRDQLFVADYKTGAVRRIALTGANLDQLGTVSIAYPGGAGGLLDLDEGPDGYLYASSVNGIHRLVPTRGPCNDGFDNDGDGRIDYGTSSSNDPGCRDAQFTSREDPECSDGVDNDRDGRVDHPADPECGAPWGSLENPPRCGLGFELALLLPVLARARALSGRAGRALPRRRGS